MELVNINGNQVHISNISNITNGNIGINTSLPNSSNITVGTTLSSGVFTTTTLTIKPQKTTYHILGEDFEVEGLRNEWISVNISHLNTYAKFGLAKVFYEELKKNNIQFSEEIDGFIQKRISVIERDRKINSIINDKSND
jgi:hypothetical protein